MTISSSSMNAESAASFSSGRSCFACTALSAALNGMLSLWSWSRRVSASRLMSRSLAPLLLCARVGFGVAALAYVTTTLVGDYFYGMGLRTRDASYFDLSAKWCPLERSHREAPAYIGIAKADPARVPKFLEALRYDPYAADLWFGLARLHLKAGNNVGYNAAMIQLRALVPGVNRWIGEGGENAQAH